MFGFGKSKPRNSAFRLDVTDSKQNEEITRQLHAISEANGHTPIHFDREMFRDLERELLASDLGPDLIDEIDLTDTRQQARMVLQYAQLLRELEDQNARNAQIILAMKCDEGTLH